jgi:hypothetical protein
MRFSGVPYITEPLNHAEKAEKEIKKRIYECHSKRKATAAAPVPA